VKIIETKGKTTRKMDGEQGREYVDALIKMYRKDGLYVMKEGALQVEEGGKGFYLSVPLPAGVAHGKTVITACAVKDGKLVGKGQSDLLVRPAGIVGWCRTMAKTNGPLYGTYAVFIALMAGVVIDMLFTRQRAFLLHWYVLLYNTVQNVVTFLVKSLVSRQPLKVFITQCVTGILENKTTASGSGTNFA